jgi:hypothetical protein
LNVNYLLSRLTKTDAANDVCVAVQIHAALKRVAEEQGIVLRENDFASDIGKPKSEIIRPRSLSPSRVAGVQPSHLRAITKFAEGMTCEEIATEGGIKVSTVR